MLTLVIAMAFQSQQPPLVRQISNVVAVSSDTLAAVTAAVEVAGGRVFVNDIIGRRVLMYDSALANPTIVADSDAAASNSYGTRPGTLMPFRGDSALFITPQSLSMLVLAPNGQITRVMAMPSMGGGMPALLGNIFGTPGFDAQGRLVFFSPVRMQFNRRGGPDDGPMRMEPPDSAYVVRYDLGTRTMDTAGVIKIPRNRSTMSRDDRGAMRMVMTAMPPTTVDDWAVTSDGRLAIVRGRDYHVDFLNADGTWTAAGRMPYAWQQLNDEAKQALVDSIYADLTVQMDSMAARRSRESGPGGSTARGGPGGGGGGGGGFMIVTERAEGGNAPVRTMAAMTPTVVKAEMGDVPDYRPAFTQGAVRADREGNLWIRTTTFVDGRPVYDVVNGQGQLVDRVQLPANRTIAGFGRGVIYMGVRDENGNTHLEKARIR